MATTRSQKKASPRKRATSRKPSASKPSLPSVPRTLPFSIDHSNRKRWLAFSLNKDVRDWEGTEAELIAHALQFLGPKANLEMLLREGLHSRCRTIVSTALSKKAAEATRGIAGQADAALEKALDDLRKAGKEITPYTLGAAAVPAVDRRAAKRFMKLRGIPIPPSKLLTRT